MTPQEISSAIEQGFAYLKSHDFPQKRDELQSQKNKEHFWDDPKSAELVMKELGKIEKLIREWEDIQSAWNALQEMKDIFSAEELEKEYSLLEESLKKAQTSLFLSGPYDDANVLMTISVGAGGVDASDWSEMVLKMFLKYAEKKNWKAEIIDLQEADPVGIKSAIVRITGGEYIYGLLRSETGHHRLVRPSPFNAKHTRETSFAHVDIIPEISAEEFSIDDKDLRIDTYRSQGAGGQSVNKTDSAVRITHIPTGIIVQCQNQRSQLQNKEQAMRVLRSKLMDMKRKEHEEKQNALRTEKPKSSFGGGHIRSYVLDDRYVKDTRTGVKTSQTEKVLDGDLDIFIEAGIQLNTQA